MVAAEGASGPRQGVLQGTGGDVAGRFAMCTESWQLPEPSAAGLPQPALDASSSLLGRGRCGVGITGQDSAGGGSGLCL